MTLCRLIFREPHITQRVNLSGLVPLRGDFRGDEDVEVIDVAFPADFALRVDRRAVDLRIGDAMRGHSRESRDTRIRSPRIVIIAPAVNASEKSSINVLTSAIRRETETSGIRMIPE